MEEQANNLAYDATSQSSMFYMFSLFPRNRNAINLLPFWAAKPEAKFHGGPLDRDYV
jgi:hypothetical protein